MRGGQRKPFRRPSSKVDAGQPAPSAEGSLPTDPDRAPDGADPGPSRLPIAAGADSNADSEGSSSRRVREGVTIAVAGAIATVIATAVFSGSTVQTVWGWIAGDNSSADSTSEQSSSQAPSTSPGSQTDMRSLATIDGAVTMRVPPSWERLPASWNLAFVESPRVGSQKSMVSPGSALEAGILEEEFFDSERLWIGASSAAAERLDMPGRAPRELLGYVKALAHQSNFELSGCSLVGEGELDVDGYYVYYRHWAGCGGFPDQTTWDVYGVTESGSTIMSALLVTTAMPETQQRQTVTGWTIDLQALPAGSPYERKGAAEFPLPPWLEAPGSTTESADKLTG